MTRMDPAMCPRDGGQTGFSFLELLVALFLVAIVLLPLVAIELQAEQQNDRVETQARALLAGRAKMEELLATPYDQLVAGDDSLGLDGSRTLARSWRVEFDQPRPEMATVSVVVAERVAEGIGLGNAPPVRITAALRKE